MFMPIDIKIEVGEYVSGYSYPYRSSDGSMKLDRITNEVESVNLKQECVKVVDYATWIPFHRIEIYTFGGIQLPHTLFDPERMWLENQKIMKNV